MPAYNETATIEDQATDLVKRAILRAVEQDRVVTPASEAQVRKAVDLLRNTNADPSLLSVIQGISCTLLLMKQLQREGQLNLYASQLLRLRSAAHSL